MPNAECRMLKAQSLKLRARSAALRLLALLFIPAIASAQTTHMLIVVGLTTETEHDEVFKKWGTTLADTATEKLGVPKENVIMLSGPHATRVAVVKAFGTLASAARPEDTVAIVLFGYGTYADRVAKFNLPGPDMTPQDFQPLLARIKAKRLVFVDTASASAPFLEALSAPGRVIITATRSPAEKYATLFGGPFVEAFSSDAADSDHDGKVSFLEAFDYAKKAVAATFVREGLLETEHALLDDTGDHQGSMTPARDGKVGQSAAVISLGSMHAQALPTDERLRTLFLERQQIERRIEELKLLKGGMDPDKYNSELEKLATELALKTRQIKEAGGGK